MAAKRLTALEMPEDEPHGLAGVPEREVLAAVQVPERRTAPQTILLPPIPDVPPRVVMVQLSIKAPLALVDRLERMRTTTGAQKQQIIAAALDAYLRGHGY
jgi:hypothetical protein